MPQFLLLLHKTPGVSYANLSPEDIQKVIEKYNTWSAKLAAAGKMRGGQKLADESGKSITRSGGRISVVDGPHSETKEVVGGYFLIDAANYDEAISLAQGCPHLEYNGRVEVREIDKMDQS
jgi:hypothetical protein